VDNYVDNQVLFFKDLASSNFHYPQFRSDCNKYFLSVNAVKELDNLWIIYLSC